METKNQPDGAKVGRLLLLIAGVIVASACLWLAVRREPVQPASAAESPITGDPVVKQGVAPKLTVKFDRDTYVIGADTEIQVTIERLVDAPEGFYLTDRMLQPVTMNGGVLNRVQLEWQRDVDVLPDGNIAQGPPLSSGRQGALSRPGEPGHKEPGDPVRLPIAVKMGLKPSFMDSASSKVWPGTYKTRVAIIGYGAVIRSEPVVIRLVAPEEATSPKPVPPLAP